MIVVFGSIFGAITGAFVAYRRKGRLADILQYSFVFFLIFTMAGLFATLFIHRVAV